MQNYGMQVFRNGLIVHRDGRPRRPSWVKWMSLLPARPSWWGRRGRVKKLTDASRRRMEFVSANVSTPLRTVITLTYHAVAGRGESDALRNYRIVTRGKRDLNRFLSCMRRELGAYLWVQEFQERGVLHYHVLCEHEVRQERVAVVWCRATEELDDPGAIRHAVLVEAIDEEGAARKYVGRYVGKGRQKQLPPGVAQGGRWWGRSRRLTLALVDEIVTSHAGTMAVDRQASRVARGVRRYLSKVLGFKVRGGRFVDWRGDLSLRVARLVAELRQFYAAGGHGEGLAETEAGRVGEQGVAR